MTVTLQCWSGRHEDCDDVVGRTTLPGHPIERCTCRCHLPQPVREALEEAEKRPPAQTTSNATRVHLGRAIDHLQEAQADLQAAILDEPALSAALRSIVLRLATDTQLVDAMHDATYAPTARDPQGAA